MVEESGLSLVENVVLKNAKTRKEEKNERREKWGQHCNKQSKTTIKMGVSCTQERESEQYVSLLLLQASYSVLRQRRINASPEKPDRRIDRQINREDLVISACILHLLLLAEAETESASTNTAIGRLHSVRAP